MALCAAPLSRFALPALRRSAPAHQIVAFATRRATAAAVRGKVHDTSAGQWWRAANSGSTGSGGSSMGKTSIIWFRKVSALGLHLNILAFQFCTGCVIGVSSQFLAPCAPFRSVSLQGLRLHDNPALLTAAAGADHLCPLFILDPWFLQPDK